jgi:hypothetical protein
MPKMKPPWNWLTMMMPLARRRISTGMAVLMLPWISWRMASQESSCVITLSRVRPWAAGRLTARAARQRTAVRNFFIGW